MHITRFLLLFLLLPGLSTISLAQSDFTNPDLYKKERLLYKQAMIALENRQFGQYEEFRSHLLHYPLISYLDYEFYRRSFATLPIHKIKSFIDNNQGQLPARRLHIEWLGHLAKNAQWPLYKQFYSPDLNSEVLACHNLQAELVLHTDDKPVYSMIGEFWLKPYNIHSACDRVFAEWQSHGYKTQQKIWRRYQRALLANNHGLSQILSIQLNQQHLAIARNIKNITGNMNFWISRLSDEHLDLGLESATEKHILKTIANSDFTKAAYILEKQATGMNKEDLMEVQRLVAWYMAKTSGESAVKWLKKHTDFRDPAFVDPLMRFSMQDKNWALYKKTFKAMPAMFKNQEEWLYWYVIAQEELGYEDDDPALKPKTLLNRLAQEQSFYGLLAARKNRSPVYPHTQFTPQSGPISEEVLKKLGPAIELYHLGDESLSNNHWFFATASFTDEQWRQAGIIAYRMGWISRTIQAFGRAKVWTAAEERFPILYRDAFWKNAKQQGVDPGWILAVARQESGFSATARSPVGALGVLQLMPATAKKVAHHLGTRYNDKQLLNPDYNIMLGTRYLKEQLDNYNNNYILATAAYNAGPGRVREWLKMRPITDDWAHWVATIPYKETRGYVQNIMSYSQVYNMKLEFQSKNEG